MTMDLRPNPADAVLTGAPGPAARSGSLTGIRVIEMADEHAEYCGLMLAGLGADVLKVEPPGGNPTRRIGPFYQDKPDPEGSLFFWQYNRGKRSVVLDLDWEGDREKLRSLLAEADVLLESTPKGKLETIDLGKGVLCRQYPTLIHARITPFGDEGPWSDYKGSDLVHLALGGVMMNCGYDPAPGGKYDLPPIAPQMWHAYHVTGEQMSMAILAALMFRHRTGKGRHVSCAVHEAVSKCTEVDLMTWVMRRAPIFRQTCRHARESVSPHPTIAHTKDGRWVMASLGNRPDDGEKLIALMEKYGIEPGRDKETAKTARRPLRARHRARQGGP
jgi:crotonobetainyl-CoA:carnitine CoA-transferase CaiB-like acyl-CoA transferase